MNPVTYIVGILFCAALNISMVIVAELPTELGKAVSVIIATVYLATGIVVDAIYQLDRKNQ